MIVWDKLTIANATNPTGVTIAPKSSDLLQINSGIYTVNDDQTYAVTLKNNDLLLQYDETNTTEINATSISLSYNNSGVENTTINPSSVTLSHTHQIGSATLSRQSLLIQQTPYTASLSASSLSLTARLPRQEYTTTIAASKIITPDLETTTATIHGGISTLSTLQVDTRAQLPSDITIGGRVLEEVCFQPITQHAVLLDAYQGPGSNWIEIRNYSSNRLTISSLQFSGNEWTNITVNSGDVWREERFDGWGYNDNPGNIIINYRAGSTSYNKTISPDVWSANGWISLTTEPADPGYRTMAKTAQFWVAVGINGPVYNVFAQDAQAEGYTNLSVAAITSGSNVYWFVAQKP